MISEKNHGPAGFPNPAGPGPMDRSLEDTEPQAMNGQPLRQTVQITNPQGFHLRPVTAFAQMAAGFASNVRVLRDGRSADGKSAWDLMTMLAPTGSELTVEVNGPDAQAALEALVSFLANLAGEEEDSPESPLSRKG